MLKNPNWQPAKTDIELEEWQNILLKAADIIVQYGWIQDKVGNVHMGFCLVGALQQAAYGQTFYSTYTDVPGNVRNDYLTACRKLGEHIHSVTLYSWNDRNYRTKDQVVAALKEAVNAGESPSG